MLSVRTWDGGGDGVHWNDPLNWDGDVAALVDGDTLVFAGVNPGTLVNDTGEGNSFTLQFNAGGYTIEGARIALDNFSAYDVVDGYGNTINTPLTLDVSSTFDISAAATILGGSIDGLGLNKTGGGGLILGGANTYSGATTVSAGLLQLGSPEALGSNTGTTTVLAGATLDLGGQTGVDEGVNLSGFGVGGNGALINSSVSAAVMTGGVYAASNTSIVNNGGKITLAGAVATNIFQLTIDGSGAIDKTGTGFNIATGGELIKNGGGTLGTTANLTVGPGAKYTHHVGTTNISGAYGLNVSGSSAGDGVVTQTGGTINALGSYCIIGSNGGDSGGKGVFNVQGGIFNAAGTSYSAWVGNGQINQTGGDVRLNNLDSATDGGHGEYYLRGGTLTVTSHAYLGFRAGTSTDFVQSGGSASFGTLVLGGVGTGGTGNYTINTSDGPSTLAVGTGGLFAGYSGSGVGNLNINGGTVTVGGDLMIGRDATTAGTVTQTAGIVTLDAARTLRFGNGNSASGTYNLNGGTLSLANIAYTSTATQHFNFGGGTLRANGPLTTAMPMTINAGGGTVDTNGNSISLSGVLDGVGGLTKTGAGTLTFGGANTYNGNTTILGGTLQLGAANAIPDGEGKGNVILDGGASEAGTFDLGGFDETINGLSGTAGTVLGQVINTATGTTKTLTVGGNNITSTFAGLLKDNNGTGGALALGKIGNGVLYLDGSNSYSGVTTVGGGGYLVARNNAALGTAAGGTVVSNGSTLQLEKLAADVTIAGEPLTISGSGVGGSRGALASWAGNNAFNGPVSLAADSSFHVYTGAGLTVGGAISGSFGIAKNGTGTLTLATANAFSGLTDVRQGSVVVTADSALGTTAGDTFVAVGAALQLSGNVDYAAVEGVRLSGDAAGGSLGNLGGNNTFRGNIRVVSGGAATRSTFAGGDVGEGLDLDGTFPYAVNVRGSAVGLVRDANFTADSVPGVTISAQNEILNWAAPNFGATTNDTRLATAMQSIRWSLHPNPVNLNLNVATGQAYRLQLLFYEPPGTRGFDILAEGNLIYDNFVSNGGAANVGTVATYEFVASDSQLNIQLSGVNTTFGDKNPILSGFTLETIPAISQTMGTANIVCSADALTLTGQIDLLGSALKVDGTGATTVSGNIVGANPVNHVTKAGSGMLTLSGNNTYGGGTTVSAGTLAVQGGTAIPDTSCVAIEFGSLILNGTETIGSLTGGGTVNLNSNTLTTGASGADTSYVGTISGSGGLTKTGGGTFTLAGTQMYSGTTTVAEGTLQLGASAVAPNIAGLAEWFDAADASTITASGGPVSQWRDKSGNGRDLAQGTAGNQPAHVLGALNGQPVVRFDGNDVLSNTYNPGTPYTVFSVAKYEGTQNYRVVTSTTNNWLLGFWGGSVDRMYAEGWVSQPNGANTATHFYGATGTGSLTTFFDGGRYIVRNSLGLAAPNGLSLGAWNGLFSSEASKADVAEVLLYNSVLTPSQIADVNAYLKTKWSAGGVLQDSSPVTVSSGGILVVNTTDTIGDLSGTGGMTLNCPLTVNQTGTTLFSGDIAGNGSLVKSGAGTLSLSGYNSYAGATTIAAGTLVAQSGAALGSTAGGTSVNSGATLALSGGVTVAGESLTLEGTGVGGNGTLRSVLGTNTYDGDITARGVTASEFTFGAAAGSTLAILGNVDLRVSRLRVVGDGTVDIPATISTTANYDDFVLSAGAQAYYRFEETSGTTAYPSIGAVNGTYDNGVSLGQSSVRPELGYAAQFDGVNDMVSAPLGVNEGPDPGYSASLWFKTSTPGRGIFNVTSSILGENDRNIYLRGDGNITARLWNEESISSTGRNYADGQWHLVTHVAGSAVGGQRLYVDGQPVASGTKNFSNFNWQNYIRVGQSSTHVGSQYFQGLIDSVAVFPKALGADEVHALYAGNALSREGSGVLVLSGNNTYAGSTSVVGGGTLLVNNVAGSGTGSGAVAVATGATLGGSGTIAGTVAVQSGGLLSPGTNPVTPTTAILRTGTVTANAGAQYRIHINGSAVGTEYDQLQVTGTVNISAATLNVSGSLTPNHAALQSFTVVANDGLDAVNGTFNGLPEGAAVDLNGQLFISYRGGDGNDVVLNSQPIVAGTDGADTLVLTPLGGGQFKYKLNADPEVTVTAATKFTFNGRGGDDLLLVNVNGNPLPADGMFYDGQSQDLTSRLPNSLGDVLKVVGTGAEIAAYLASAVTTGAGTVAVTGGMVNFTGLEPVDIQGMATATVTLPGGNDLVTVANGFDAATGTQAAMVVSGTSGGVAFESVHLRGNASVVIDTTTVPGDDTVTLSGADNAHGNTNLNIATGTGGDSVRVNGPITFAGNISIASQSIAVDALITAGASAMVTLNANAGSITTVDSDVDVDAGTLVASAAGGITLDTAVDIVTFDSAGAVDIDNMGDLQLSGANTASSLALASSGAITDDADADVTVGAAASFDAASIMLGDQVGNVVNFGTLTFSATSGGASIREDSAMLLAGASSAAGAIVLSVEEGPTGSAAEDLTVPSGASVASIGGSVTLNVADDLELPLGANISAATTITVNVDRVGDNDAAGSTVNLAGTLVATMTSISGGDDNDVFNLDPQVGSPIGLDGQPPVMGDVGVPPGDQLNLDLSGLTATLSIAGTNNRGRWTFAGAGAPQPIDYQSIETVATLPPGVLYGLRLDMVFAGFQNNDTDVILVETLSGNTELRISVDGEQVFRGFTEEIRDFDIVGSQDHDVLDYSLLTGPIDVTISGTGSVDGYKGGLDIPVAVDPLHLGGELPQTFDNIDGLVGSQGADTLRGPDRNTTWTIIGANAGTIADGISAAALLLRGTMPDLPATGQSMSFSGVENLVGNAANDWLLFADAAAISGTIDGRGGNDTLDYRDYTTGVPVDLTTGTATGVRGGAAGGIAIGLSGDVGSSIENVFGGSGNERTGAGPDYLPGIVGDEDANVLGDGFGSDVLAGGLGDDRYVLTPDGTRQDVLVETGGTDTIDFSTETLLLGVEFDMDLLEVDQHVFDAAGGTGPTVRMTRQAPAPAPSPFENFIGSRQADIVWIDPLSVLRAVEGNDPTSVPGDRLNFEASGSVVQDNGAMLMASGIGGVYYTEIERIELYNAAARTIDNGDTGWDYGGAWVETAGSGYLGDVHVHAAGATSDVASWTFDGVTPGKFLVSITWPAGTDRTASASVRILDGSTPVWSGTIDQQTLGLAEANFVDGGVAWVDLGGLQTITGHTLRVELTDGSGVGKLAADAVQIERVTAGEAEIRVIEQGTKQDIADGTGSFSFGETPKDTPASRTFVVQNLGTLPLVLGSLTLPARFRSAFVGATVNPGESTAITVTLDATAAGQFAGQLLLATNDSNESPFDFRLSGTVTAAAAMANIVDIGDDGFSVLSGQWRLVPEDARYFNEDHLWNEPGPEVEQVQWLFTGLDVGSFYRVSATWLADPNRSTAAPYTIASGTKTAATTIDQQRSPSSYPNAFQAADRDGREYWFADLAAGFEAMSETLTVRLSRTSVGYVIADAVRVEKLSLPEISVYDGEVVTESAELRDGTSVIDFGATELGRPVSRTCTIRNVGGDMLDLIEPIRVPLGFSLASSFTGTDASSSDAGFQLAPGSTTTFIVQMNGQAPGPLVGVVAVTSDDADESPFEFTVTGAVGTQIIDDGDPGFQLTAGTWYSNVQDPRYFEHDHRYATAGTGTTKAVWRFTDLQPGATYQVSATWLEDPNRATNAPYRVRVDGVENGVVRVNQQLAPADFSDEGAFWEELGAFTLGSGETTLEVELFNDANGYVIADGMRIQHVYLPEIEVQVDADGRVLEDGRSEVDFGTALVGAPAVKTFRVRNLGQLPLELLNLSLLQSIPAGYELASPLSATMLGPNDAQTGGSDEATFVIRQLAGTLGKYSGTVSLASTDMDESPLEFTVRGEVASNRIIDNDTPGFSSPASTWRVGATHTGYFASTHRYHARTTTAGAAVATWTFTNLQPGEYKVYATWMADFNRATDAKYTVSSGDQSVPATVNQRLAPQGLETWGDDPKNAAKKVTWKLIAGGALGAFVVPDTAALTETLTVSLRTSTLGYVIADAVRLEYVVSPLKAEAAGTATLPNAAPLTAAALAPLVEEAQTRWSAGLDVSQRQLLSDTRYVIADLGGRTLALASPATKTIYVDDDAAGHGWFVDATPSVDEEYPQVVSAGRAAIVQTPAAGKMDLLTAVLHEMGHLLDKPDLDASISGDDLMSDRLPAGTRRAPHDARDQLFAARAWDE